MIAPLIDPDQVYREADALVAGGDRPTIALIYERIGKIGSYGTISKYLKEWRQQRGYSRVFPLPKREQELIGELPDNLQADSTRFLKTLWQTAVEQAINDAQKLVQKAEQEVLQAREESESALIEVKKLETELAQLILRERSQATALEKVQVGLELRMEEVAALTKKVALMEITIYDYTSSIALEKAQSEQLHKRQKELNEELLKVRRDFEEQRGAIEQKQLEKMDLLSQLQQLTKENKELQETCNNLKESERELILSLQTERAQQLELNQKFVELSERVGGFLADSVRKP
jgi:chromosome segregation ATPase